MIDDYHIALDRLYKRFDNFSHKKEENIKIKSDLTVFELKRMRYFMKKSYVLPLKNKIKLYRKISKIICEEIQNMEKTE